jgi:hypothetical protein
MFNKRSIKMKTKIVVGSLAALLVSSNAYALDASTPISASNGTISCPTCVVEDSVSQYGIPVWGSTQNLNVITPSSQTTYALFSAGTGANPAFRAIAAGDLPSLTSSQVASLVSDETGTAGNLVFSTNPSLAGVTVTGTADLTGATVNLSSSAVDAIGEIATAIKSGGANAVKVVTTTSGSTTTNNCAKWDANGNLVDAGTGCGGGSVISISGETKINASTTALYMSLNGNLSTTEGDVTTPIADGGTLGSFQCVASGSTTQAVTAVIGHGTCGSTISYTSKAQVVMSTTANTTGTSSGSSVVTAGQCAVIKLTTTTGTSGSVFINCSVSKTA